MNVFDEEMGPWCSQDEALWLAMCASAALTRAETTAFYTLVNSTVIQ